MHTCELDRSEIESDLNVNAQMRTEIVQCKIDLNSVNSFSKRTEVDLRSIQLKSILVWTALSLALPWPWSAQSKYGAFTRTSSLWPRPCNDYIFYSMWNVLTKWRMHVFWCGLLKMRNRRKNRIKSTLFWTRFSRVCRLISLRPKARPKVFTLTYGWLRPGLGQRMMWVLVLLSVFCVVLTKSVCWVLLSAIVFMFH